MRNSLLLTSPKTYLFWWTIIPSLPESRSDPQYQMLKRLWADHTMNCLSNKTGDWKLASSRGFYVQGREDHITPALFHIWAAFPDSSWVASLLDLWAIPHRHVRSAKWSYSWEQKRDLSRRPDITDIVVCWEDEQGQAVLVIEAKRAGGKLSDKDLNGGTGYLQLPSIREFERKAVAFLVDEADVVPASAVLPPNTPITSWQAMGRLQAAHASQQTLALEARELLCSFIAKHYADLGFPLGPKWNLPLGETFDGSEPRYKSFKTIAAPGSVERFLLGSEAVFCAREGRMPHPPMEWLAGEPSFVDVVIARSQTTADREKCYWRL
jgi:hypothetical protein